MKRYPFVITATAAGLAGVLSFHTHRASTSLPIGPPAGTGNTAASGQGSRSSASSGTTPGTPRAPSTGAPRTARGALEQYGYGQLSVRVTMSGGRITRVALGTLQTADTYSQQLADQVIPVLAREVLSAQSARIDGVSGATYTSEAYAASVQSALDTLHTHRSGA